MLATGGAVANTGRALHRLGVRTRLMGKVGDDLFGRAIRQILAAESPALGEGLIVSPGEHTSYSVILSPTGADRMLFHAPGCNATFGADDLRYDDLDSAHLLHVGYPPLMDRLWRDGGSQLAALFRRAKERGVTTSLDVAMPSMESDAARADWNTILRAALPYVDLFLPSASEVLLLCRRPLYDQLRNESDDTGLVDHLAPSLLNELSTGFLGMGARIVGLKLGHRGLYLRTAGAHVLAEMGRAQPADVVPWAARELLAPCFATTVVGTTGAGDVTVARLFMALLRGMAPEETLTAACAIGACSVCWHAASLADLLNTTMTLRQGQGQASVVSRSWYTAVCMSGSEVARRSRARGGDVTRVRGKSELHRARCWLTASGGDPKDSATETYRLRMGTPARR